LAFHRDVKREEMLKKINDLCFHTQELVKQRKPLKSRFEIMKKPELNVHVTEKEISKAKLVSLKILIKLLKTLSKEIKGKK